jgi:hypothetical protein
MLETPEQFRGRAGQVDLGANLDFRSRGQVWRDFVVALLLVLGFVTLTFWLAWPELRPICIALPLFASYCGVAYAVRVRPNHDELGLGGGIIDNPLRMSDGANRFLIQIAVFLALGRFISFGLIDGLRLIRRGQLPQDQFLQDLEEDAPDARQ